NTAKTLQIVDASALVNSRSLNISQKIFLKGFYPQDTSQEFGLTMFEKDNVILVTGKFRIVEYVNENNEKLLALKILLNDVVCFDLDPSEIPKFPILINMTAVVQKPPTIKNNDALMAVTLTDYMDQERTVIEVDCYYSATAPHLTRLTPTIKKNSVLYISGEFILHDNKNYVYIKNMSYSDFQKSILDVNVSTKVLWQDKTQNEANKSISIAETLAAKFDNNTRNKKSSSTTASLTVKSISAIKNSSKIQPSSVIKTSTTLKLPSVSTKSYTRTRGRRKLSDLAK
ncbi:3251_t:CDS:2, partial [Cetraspora pellucida]